MKAKGLYMKNEDEYYNAKELELPAEPKLVYTPFHFRLQDVKRMWLITGGKEMNVLFDDDDTWTLKYDKALYNAISDYLDGNKE